jgi:hypothetical protein
MYCVKTTKHKSYAIKARQADIKWNDDIVTMFDIGRAECDQDEYPADWVPTYLRVSLDQPNTRKAAIVAIGDYLAGWESGL